jgi:hypothetical protein
MSLFSMPTNSQFAREAEYLHRRALAAEVADPQLRPLKEASNSAWRQASQSTKTTENGLMEPSLVSKALDAENALLAHINRHRV